MKKSLFSLRAWLQGGWALLTNPHLGNFLSGKIYQGNIKNVCVPGLNCYSCPAATGACPLGSLQSILSGNRTFPAYVLGFLVLFGVLLGRAVCGFLCPFGWIQELLHRIGGERLRLTLPKKLDAALRYVKYAVLLVLVIALPLFVTGAYGQGTPFFCKYICPAGTLEAGIPLALSNPSVRAALGGLFTWKSAFLVVMIVASVFIFRPFCKYICPLGAIYALFNRVSFVRLRVRESQCVACGKCEKNCPMQVPVLTNINSAECIRCGKCVLGCPTQAIRVENPLSIQNEEEKADEAL